MNIEDSTWCRVGHPVDLVLRDEIAEATWYVVDDGVQVRVQVPIREAIEHIYEKELKRSL